MPNRPSDHAIDRGRADELYRAYGPAVYRRCLALLRDPDSAANQTQQVFLRVLRHPERFEQRSGLLNWLFDVTDQHCDLAVTHARTLQGDLAERGTA